MRDHCWIGALLVVVALGGGVARADLIAGNFGPGDSYQTDTGTSWASGYPLYPTADTQFSNAVGFTNTSSNIYALDQFRFAANYFGGENQLLVGFYGGSSDLNSATLLESFTFTALTLYDVYIYTATSIVHPLLLPGESYFIVLSTPQTPGTVWGWQWNDQGATGFYSRRDSGAWVPGDDQVSPVFDVRGSVQLAAVPEPSALVLSGVRLSSLAVARMLRVSRRRQANLAIDA